MKDEKLAQESWFSEDNGYRIMTNEATYIYAFKKGLKAARPEWHDINDTEPSKEQLEKDYYKDRPIEPYCTDEMPNDWAELAHYAEHNLEKAFKQIEELEQQIDKMRNFENCDYQLHVVDCPIFKSGGHISCKKCPHWILQEATK